VKLEQFLGPPIEKIKFKDVVELVKKEALLYEIIRMEYLFEKGKE
jgi:hypothetical protein